MEELVRDRDAWGCPHAGSAVCRRLPVRRRHPTHDDHCEIGSVAESKRRCVAVGLHAQLRGVRIGEVSNPGRPQSRVRHISVKVGWGMFWKVWSWNWPCSSQMRLVGATCGWSVCGPQDSQHSTTNSACFNQGSGGSREAPTLRRLSLPTVSGSVEQCRSEDDVLHHAGEDSGRCVGCKWRGTSVVVDVPLEVLKSGTSLKATRGDAERIFLRRAIMMRTAHVLSRSSQGSQVALVEVISEAHSECGSCSCSCPA